MLDEDVQVIEQELRTEGRIMVDDDLVVLRIEGEQFLFHQHLHPWLLHLKRNTAEGRREERNQFSIFGEFYAVAKDKKPG